MTTEAQKNQIHTEKCFGAEVKELTDQVEKAVYRAKGAVSGKMEDGRIAVERLLEHSRYAVEDGVETAVRQVKRNPVSSVLVAFAAGAIVGLLVTYLGRRNRL